MSRPFSTESTQHSKPGKNSGGDAESQSDATRFRSLSGNVLKPFYCREDIADLDEARDLGTPGEYPFTRGVHKTMYRGRTWTMRQFAGFGTSVETNRRFHYLLEQGQTGLSVAFDFPTITGYDSDDPMSEGEVGRCGVAIASLADMETLLGGIPLDQVSTSMTINGPAAVLLAFYVAMAKKQGVPLDKLRGTTQNDVLKEYQAQKSWCFPPHPSMRVVNDIIEYCGKEVPLWNTISISGYHIREAGSTALQELAFTLANGFAYVESGIKAGLDVDDFAPRLSFFFDAHLDFFEEIAKFRAARRIWARHMREKYGAKNPRSWLVRFHTQTAGVSLTAQQPENNIVRTACEALSAVLGGTQSLHTNSMDETLALPTEKAAKIALRTQQILAHEIGVANVADPLAGSYYVEALTNQMESEAEEIFRKIEAMGGVIQGIENGYFQREIAASAYRFQKEMDAKSRVVVGVNRFVDEQEEPLDILRIGVEVEAEQRERLARLRSSRNETEVRNALTALADAAKNGDNVMPCLVEGALAYATLGEMIATLKQEFGEYREPPMF
ncbi:MAG: methylmalonyl-CoA mutase family protein [Planctomycetota bacterium]